jgi:hypothetical protein
MTLLPGIRHCPLLQEMVYDSFVAGRSLPPLFFCDGPERC